MSLKLGRLETLKDVILRADPLPTGFSLGRTQQRATAANCPLARKLHQLQGSDVTGATSGHFSALC